MIIKNVLISALLVSLKLCYLDINLDLVKSGSEVMYSMPMLVGDKEYAVGIAIENLGEFLVPFDQIQSKNKKKKKSKRNTFQENKAIVRASSLEGYSFEGWKRFFLEALLWAESRYYHEITIDISELPH